MAFWLVQSNSYNDGDYQKIINAMKWTNSQFKSVSMRPFTNEVRGLPNNYKELPIVLLGTVNFAKWGQKKNLPGVWWNDNFNFEIQKNFYKDEMLNFDSEIHLFGDIPKYEGERFIRPVDDGKAFSGEIVSYNRLSAWQDSILYLNSKQLKPTTKVQLASVKSIFREYRLFMVNGRYVAGSMYFEDNKYIRKRMSLNMIESTDDFIVEYAEDMANIWMPDKVFVMDIALLNDGTMKIIEINNANASGLYESDVSSFIHAVNLIL